VWSERWGVLVGRSDGDGVTTRASLRRWAQRAEMQPPARPCSLGDGRGRPDGCLVDGLVGCAIPALRLTNHVGRPTELHRETGAAGVIYTYPGSGGSRFADLAQHLAFEAHRRDLEDLWLRVFGLSSESSRGQLRRVCETRICHELLSDPGLRFARALRLPTVVDEGVDCYRRLTLGLSLVGS
jgi:peroxiredoxin